MVDGWAYILLQDPPCTSVRRSALRGSLRGVQVIIGQLDSTGLVETKYATLGLDPLEPGQNVLLA